MNNHNQNLASAFDSQAAQFERAPVQTDPLALARLVAFSRFPENAYLLDAGCGPGLVSEAFLKGGYRVFGVDLSQEMITRARRRGAEFGDRARFEQASLFDSIAEEAGPFEGAVSRYVLHHVADPIDFVSRQVALLKRGGILVLSDHTTDPDPALAERHQRFEWSRDTTHTNNLTAGAIVDLFAKVGLSGIESTEEAFTLDFDEWFDRGTPGVEKAELRQAILETPRPRGFRASESDDGRVVIDCFRAIVRGVKG